MGGLRDMKPGTILFTKPSINYLYAAIYEGINNDYGYYAVRYTGGISPIPQHTVVHYKTLTELFEVWGR